jgi:hypothetical protein
MRRRRHNKRQTTSGQTLRYPEFVRRPLHCSLEYGHCDHDVNRYGTTEFVSFPLYLEMDSSRSSSNRASNSSASLSANSLPSQKADQTAAAAASLNLLLREDRLLVIHGLTESGTQPDKVAFPYAAALLADGDDSNTVNTKQRADGALQDVERKLALVESLAVKLSRTSPEAVAGHLLRLHGYHLPKEGLKEDKPSSTTLSAVRDKADRLERQSEVLENVARRVEGSLSRGLKRMETACTRLERVLSLSNTLKMILRLQFENSKLQNYDLEDLRDLTRAAASVSVVEDLLKRSELQASIEAIQKIRPEVERTATDVRQSAAMLLQDQYHQKNAIHQLGGTLQVYYHLGELPGAVWKVVENAHGKAESTSRDLWNALTLMNLTEQAKKTAKDSRSVEKKLKQMRAEAASQWANGIYDVSTQVRNLQRVLMRKSDPIQRQFFVDVVAAASIPAAFRDSSLGKDFSLFGLFWGRFCKSLGIILEDILQQDNGKHRSDVASLYPSVRSVSNDMLSTLQDNLNAGNSALEDLGTAATPGILGGSALLDDTFLDWTTGQFDVEENPQSATTPDSWTHTTQRSASAKHPSQRFSASGGTGSATMSQIYQSMEWNTLQGDKKGRHGLYPLQQAFIEACTDRLCSPLQFMFPENVALDDDGVAIASGLSMLPSKYDIQRFDENIRQEISLADPKEGGGDLSSVTMIANCVVSMISELCLRAKNALSGIGESGYLNSDWSMTESLKHDRKVTVILFTVANYLRIAPDTVFLAPYRPSISLQQEEAASVCQVALQPALKEIEKMVKNSVTSPLGRAINKRIGDTMAKMHQGVYLGSNVGIDEDSPAFVQKHLNGIYEIISKEILSKLPPEYGSAVATSVAMFSIYNFVSNFTLLRPLGESARLHITQDLADLELALEQLMLKSGNSVSLHFIGNGKPYLELRAVRQMLFWTGLDSAGKQAVDVAKSLLREPWMKDVRPSTIFHYLYSYAPSFLSSPYHTRRMKPEAYVRLLVKPDGSVEETEDDAWMTVMASCDAYQQRASSGGSNMDGDIRVAEKLLTMGPDVMRRRGH